MPNTKPVYIPDTASLSQVIQILQTDPAHGLSHAEALARLQAHGPNDISGRAKQSILHEFFSRLIDPLLFILIVIAGISFFLGQYLDGTIILLMVLLSSILNFLQEHKATRAAEKLLLTQSLHVVVVRNGKEETIKASRIIPGDIVLLNAGDVIPADCRLYQCKDFFVNESGLTGESFPVEKFVQEGGKNGESARARIFMGTAVVTGTARAVVVKTGKQTQFGSIATSLVGQKDENDFTRGIATFSSFILRIIIVFVLCIFLLNALVKQNIFDSLLFATAVAVGLTPEFLPMILSVTMAMGAVAMGKKGVIVKKLTAIPSFGSMDILCSDKTGTLTKDHIELIKTVDMKGNDIDTVFPLAYWNSVFQTGIENPMDEAIKQWKAPPAKTAKKIEEIPFDFERKRLSVVIEYAHDTKKQVLITKGAPEEMLHVLLSLSPRQKQWYEQTYQELSRHGFRVLAVATKTVDKTDHTFTKQDECDLTFAGFMAFLDPVKPKVKEAIDNLESLGIEIKIITGDNEHVAEKICTDAGIISKGLMLGSALPHMSNAALATRALATTIFARFSPQDKLRVIEVLKSRGRVVGYMGDGINDAPSLESADVGISVSNAVAVAKESADLILTHKSLEDLAEGVKEGRKIFGNTMKYIMMGLSSNFGNMFSLLGAVIFLPFLPMLPIQILLNNFLYDLSQIFIPIDTVDEEYLAKPKRWNMRDVRNFMFMFGPISSLFDFLSFFLLYRLFSGDARSFQTGWFMESLATQVLVIHVIRTRKIPFFQSRASTLLTISTTVVLVAGWFLPFTPIGHIFQLVPLPVHAMVTIAGIVFSYLIFTEGAKHLFYRLFTHTVPFHKHTS